MKQLFVSLMFFLFLGENVLLAKLFTKIVIFTDKNVYYESEYIYFSLFVVDIYGFGLDSSQQITTVELIGPEKKIVANQNLMIRNGNASGYFVIKDNFVKGYYQLRAYNEVDKNISSEFYATAVVFVNTNNLVVENLNNKKTKKIVYEVFDNAIYASTSNMIYYCIDKKFKNISVVVENDKKTIVAQNTNNNVGVLSFDVDSTTRFVRFIIKSTRKKLVDKKFYVKNKNNLVNYFSNDSNILFVFTIQKNKHNTKKNNNKYVDTLLYNKNFLKPGLNIVDMSKEKTEQAFFYLNIEHLDSLDVSVNSNKIEVKNNSQHKVFLSVVQNNDNYDISISRKIFYDDANYAAKKFVNYCNANNIQYCIQQKYVGLINNKSLIDKTAKGIDISGNVSLFFEKIPAKNIQLKLSILNTFNDYYTTTTNSEGIFEFNNLSYYDTIHYLIEVVDNKIAKKSIIFVEEYDTLKIYFDIPTDSNIRYTTKSQNINKRSNSLYSNSDYVFTSNDIQRSGASNVFDFLKGRVAGMDIVGDNIYIRGRKSIMLSNDPLFMIDNVPVEKSAIYEMDMQIIDRIEIVKSNSSSAIYGQRGANGIVSIYTKKGHNIQWGYTQGKIVGLSRPTSFKYNNQSHSIKTYQWFAFVEIEPHSSYYFDKTTQSNFFVKLKGFASNGKIIDICKSF